MLFLNRFGELLPLVSGKTSMPDTVDSVVTCDVFLKLDCECDSLKVKQCL